MIETLSDSINSLTDVDFSVPSEVEVVMDNLASSLIAQQKLDKRKEFWGRTPSLFEVISVLVDKGALPPEADSVGTDVKYLLREAYGDELDEYQSEELESGVEELKSILTEALIDE